LIATLYFIWAGGNDFLFNNTITPVQIVNSLAISIKALLDTGAKNLLVFNEAPIQALPIISLYHQSTYFASFTQAGNNALNATFASFQQNYPQASIYMFDLHALITNVMANNPPIFTSTVDACWTIKITTRALQGRAGQGYKNFYRAGCRVRKS